MKSFLLLIIRIYQKTLSPDHGIFCNFYGYKRCIYYPSCSAYMYSAIKQKGAFIGILKGIFRILRCNPFSKGGFDPIK